MRQHSVVFIKVFNRLALVAYGTNNLAIYVSKFAAVFLVSNPDFGWGVVGCAHKVNSCILKVLDPGTHLNLPRPSVSRLREQVYVTGSNCIRVELCVLAVIQSAGGAD